MTQIEQKAGGICNADTILQLALQNHYAIAHINANNLEWIKAIIETATETFSPIIIGFSPNAIKYIGGYKTVVDLVTDLALELNYNNVPIAIHLDHGNYENCIQAMNAGFTSIMFDGSKLPFESNYHQTVELLRLARIKNVSLEVEIGQIGTNKALGELADLNECKLLGTLPISCLAVGIGNIHGLYPKDWKGLNFELLNAIHNEIKRVPLVLHGGTGIDDEQIKRAIFLGVAKININTECQLAFQKALRNYFEQKQDLDEMNKGYDPRKILGVGTKAIKEVIKAKLTFFESLGVVK